MRMVRAFTSSLITVVLLAPALGTAPVAAQESPACHLPAPAGAELRVSQGTYSDRSHQGAQAEALDFVIPAGSCFPVAVARVGTVIAARYDVAEGACPYTGQTVAPACWTDVNYVLVDHGDGTSTLYQHLAPGDAPVTVGQVVETGTPLGTAGSSGWSSGTHLHFQVPDTLSAATPARSGGFLGTARPVSFADLDVLTLPLAAVGTADDASSPSGGTM